MLGIQLFFDFFLESTAEAFTCSGGMRSTGSRNLNDYCLLGVLLVVIEPFLDFLKCCGELYAISQ